MQPIQFTVLYQIKIILDELVEMIKEYSILGFPFTSQEIRTIAYKFAEEHSIPGFSDQKEIAGQQGLHSPHDNTLGGNTMIHGA